MSKSLTNFDAEFLDATATAAVTALRSLRLALPLSATLMLSACASGGLELAALATADPASGGAASSTPSSTSPGSIVTGSLSPIEDAPQVSRREAKTATADLAASSPTIVKSRQLRANGDLQGAMTTLEAEAKNKPDDADLLRERGLLALELGRIDEARKLLKKADSAGAPDWRIKSALGSAYAASGDQQAAQREFAAALKLVPDHPSVLNNLALSYALDGRHDQAEKLLRTAARSNVAAPKAKQNLALLLGLNGQLDEARKVSEAALPQNLARSNISYLERLKSEGTKTSRVVRPASENNVASRTSDASSKSND